MSSDSSPAAGLTRLLRPRLLVPALVALLVILMLVGGRLDRAPTSGRYRPAVPAAAFTGLCDPFPAGFTLDLPYQVRADRILDVDGGQVRRLDLHYDELSAAEVTRRIESAATAAGLLGVSAGAVEDPEVSRWFEGEGYGRLGFGVEPFAGVSEDDVVRGRLTIDLPVTTLTAEVEAACDNPVQTKRFDFEGYAQAEDDGDDDDD